MTVLPSLPSRNLGSDGNQSAALGMSSPLPRTLTLIETLGFGLTGLLLWISVAPGVHAELGAQSMWVWIPGAFLGAIVNFQVRQLGQQFPDVSGGTPSYLGYLLPEVPFITRYAAIGYCLSWIAVIPINAIILTELIQANLVPLGICLPDISLKIGFVLLPFLVAFSGSRALSTLHLVFLLPAVGLLLIFCVQGSVWLLNSSSSQTQIASLPAATPFSVMSWAKWYLSGTYAFYACETAAAFVADSKQPQKTLQSLVVVAALIPVVYIFGPWLLLHLTDRAVTDDTFLTLLAAAKPYWGAATSLLVTFLVVSSSLLVFATAVSVAPRVLYQLARDQQLPPLFATVSEQGVFGPGLGLVLLLGLVGLCWGDVHQIVMVTGVGWLISFIVLHVGLWFRGAQIGERSDNQPVVGTKRMMPWLALAMAGLEVFVLCVGGWLPGLVIAGMTLGDTWLRWAAATDSLSVGRVGQWSQRVYHRLVSGRAFESTFESLITAQIALLVGFTSAVAAVSWWASEQTANNTADTSVNLLVVLVLVMSFIGVAIACWTVFPQINAINTARYKAEALSEELDATLKRLQQTQMQMVQQEKLSSLGQLVAGVAHEINNPVSFIHGNLSHSQDYVRSLLALVRLYRRVYPNPPSEIETEIEDMDLEFLSTDLPKMLNSMTIGTDRIREIVLSLRNFSRKDEAACKSVDVHEGIDSTLLILQHRLKATHKRPAIEVIRDYDELPMIECYPSQLNQVFMNIFANAIDAVEETNAGRDYEEIEAEPNRITVRTSVVGKEWLEVAIADNGPGIPKRVRDRIFDPFFTTKPAGKGTGLGMSISYQIITQHHQGKLLCFSEPNQGTEFTIQIPLEQNLTGKEAL